MNNHKLKRMSYFIETSEKENQTSSATNNGVEQQAEKVGSIPQELFSKILINQEEYDPSKFRWNDDNTVELKGISGSTVHKFVLELEEMGKAVTFERSLTIRIKDRD